MTHLAKQQFTNMILGLLLFAAVAPISLCADDSGLGADGSESVAGRNARMKWWREARFGMFIHWNVSSVPAGVYHGKYN
ncbi:MAG: alpha-L-fucosidase, partial [bacterium]